MWVYLIDPPPPLSPLGQSSRPFRSVFFKGNSNASTGRTPSVWLLPDSNVMTIRVSTEKNTDTAVESFTTVPSFQWTLLTFVFTNVSAAFSANASDMCSRAGALQSSVDSAAAAGVELSTEIGYNMVDAADGEVCPRMESSAEDTARSTQYTIDVYNNDILDIRYASPPKIWMMYHCLNCLLVTAVFLIQQKYSEMQSLCSYLSPHLIQVKNCSASIQLNSL